MNAASSSGELENPSKPTFLNLAWTSGLSMTSRSAVLSFFTIAAGVPGRRDEASPGIEIEAFYSGLIHGRQVRIKRAPLYARYRQRAHSARFDMRLSGGEVGEHHRHSAGDDVHKRRSCGFVRYMQHTDLGPLCHRVAADNAGRVTAGERQLARIRLGIVDQFLDRMDRQVWIDYEHQSETSYAGDRHKVLDRIVAQAQVYERVGGQRRVGPH